MAKAKRQLADRMKQVDFVIEVADARAPRSTRNPELEPLINERPRLLVLAKADLADAGATRAWRDRYAEESVHAVSASLLDSKEVRRIRSGLQRITQRLGGSQGRAPKIPGVRMPRTSRSGFRGMVVGMPNTGKSSLIRALGGGRVAKGDRPGVTRGVQDLSLGESLTLLDTPGMLWPRAVEGKTALHLAWLGCVGERSFDLVAAGVALLERLREKDDWDRLNGYALDRTCGPEAHEVLRHIATRMGRSADGERLVAEGAAILLRDVRAGRLGGPLSLEWPDDNDDPDGVDE